jgi:hypothetical protein
VRRRHVPLVRRLVDVAQRNGPDSLLGEEALCSKDQGGLTTRGAFGNSICLLGHYQPRAIA